MKPVNYNEIPIKQLSDNPVELIGDDWMLITAGNVSNFNTMTASWGTVGVLWQLPVVIVFVRPQRYTFDFMNEAQRFTLSFFNNKDKKILAYCGKYSGREVDKVKETGLIPFETKHNMVSFEQSRLFIECKTLYSDDFKSDNFLIKEIAETHYSKNNFHRFYIGQILGTYVKK